MSDRHASDLIFAGSLPELYDRHLVPLIFDPYADDLVTRLRDLDLGSVLEVAAGSGVVTRAMASGLPASVSITATDLSQPVIDYGQSVGTSRPVVWQSGDVMDLPFGDASFDAVVCQFGVMFFPDRPAAFAEVARVLRPGGVFLFNVWDAIEQNEFAAVVTAAVGGLFADDPPLFLARTPYSISTRPRSRPMSQPADSFHRRVSRCWRLGAGQGRPRSRRLPSARAHRCATRSRPDTHHVLPKQPRWPQRPSKNASERQMSTARSAALSSPPPGP